MFFVHRSIQQYIHMGLSINDVQCPYSWSVSLPMIIAVDEQNGGTNVDGQLCTGPAVDIQWSPFRRRQWGCYVRHGITSHGTSHGLVVSPDFAILQSIGFGIVSC